MKILILGTGCPRCNALAKNAEIAADELGVEHVIEKVTEMDKILSFGVMMTPALVVDGEVKVVGKVPSPEEIKKMLS